MNKVALWILIALVAADVVGTWSVNAKLSRTYKKTEIQLGREEAKAISDLGTKLIAECGGDYREAYRRQAVAREPMRLEAEALHREISARQ